MGGEDHGLIEHRLQLLETGQGELSKRTGEQTDTISNFLVRQADTFAQFRLDLLEEVRAIERSIASKCEQDSAIIATQNRELTHVDRVERDEEETAKVLAVVAASMENLKKDNAKDLAAAHDAIRGHGARLKTLEAKGGKLAVKVLFAGAGVAGTAAITWAVMKLLEGGPR